MGTVIGMSDFTLDKPIVKNDGTIVVIVRDETGKQVGYNTTAPSDEPTA